MFTGKLIFIALSLLSVAAGISSGYTLPVLIVTAFIWLRVLIQKNGVLLIVSILVTLLFSVRFAYFYPTGSSITLSENEWVSVAVKETSWKVDGDKLEFEGLIQQDSVREKVKVIYYIKSEGEKHRLAASIPKSAAIKGILSIPEEPSNFNQFNYGTYLKSKKIFNILKASELAVWEHEQEKPRDVYVFDSFRQEILSHIDRTLTPKTSAYTKTLLFADKRSFSSDVMDSFKELGIVHLLSISGLHVVFLIDLIRLSLLRMRISKEATASSLILILPLYGIATGFGVSVFRAVGQAWLKLLGDKLNLTVTALDSWSMMLILTLFIQPYSLYMIGFQLSYLISFMIIVLAHQPFFKQGTKVETYVTMNLLLLVSSIPVLSYHFYEFSWGVLVLNSLFIPLVGSLLLPLLIVSLLLSLLIPSSLIFEGILFMIDKLITAMETIVSETASSLTFTFVTGRLSQAAYFLLALFILVLLVMIEKNRPKRFLPFPVIGIIICVLSVRFSPLGQVLMIDVGQGEAILIKEPWGRGNYLIDTGGQAEFPVEEWQNREKIFNVGENIILPVLKSEGVHKLQSIIITHPDIDHYGAMMDIISHMRTEQVVSAKTTFLEENFQSQFSSIVKFGTVIKEAAEGSGIYLPKNTFAVLSNEEMTTASKNDSSLVLYGLIGRKTWLFTGDLEAEGEKVLLEKYPNMTADILKVGHHGSQTSSHDGFINQLRPETAWISAGKSNRYGHPHDNVTEKLRDRDINIYRTDTNGAVRYRFTDQYPLVIIDSYLFSFEQKRGQRGE
ncbi:competence protein ComEC [Alkalibacterium putridalgicola]|uniref:ComE operon protein 3 n=1 Tax=Alkalibacterium putridalgicola TaxID=426703 RepID=A0A1H7Q7X1_9LACT|nr:DNA internalization-related competence protein ComEC/Rec2 [Alkalibacterium putridalgicola]GEK88022.1 ComE operon protein 3 [Alkalibacterium putridalgicola]SEL43595.1 competence protein ComEC [Alkalibacterium putridalgicola]